MEIYIVILVVVMAASVLFTHLYDRKMMGVIGKDSLNISTNDKEKIVDNALRQLNCEGAWSTSKEGRSVLYDYQNGHFRIRINNGEPYIELGYFYCFSTDMENINTVRYLCNLCNMSTETSLLFYNMEEEKNKVNVHIVSKLLPDKKLTKAVLARAMADMFHWQTAFTRGFDNQLEASKKAELRDVEADHSQWKRLMFLLREQEIQHQEVSAKERLGVGVPLTIGEIMETMFAITEIRPKRLTIANDGVSYLIDENTISEYNVADAIIKDGKCQCHEATLSVEFYDLRYPDIERYMVIHIKEEEGTEQTIYLRLTATLIPSSVNRHPSPLTSDNTPQSRSMLIAYDLMSTEQMRNEFLYMKKEAEAMHKKGDDDKLSEEQRVLIDCTDDNLGYHLYHGKRLFLAKRFLEAEPHLRKAFDILMPAFPNMNVSLQEAFYDSCFMLGFCYDEMQQYQRAFYFLEMLFPLRRITYTEEYINCLVNQHDFRVLQVIDSVQEMVDRILHSENEEGDKDEESDSSDSTDSANTPHEENSTLTLFASFLKRRKAYVLIEKGEYNEARNILNELLNDPDSSDFAMNELAYLQKRKPTPTPPEGKGVGLP